MTPKKLLEVLQQHYQIKGMSVKDMDINIVMENQEDDLFAEKPLIPKVKSITLYF